MTFLFSDHPILQLEVPEDFPCSGSQSYVPATIAVFMCLISVIITMIAVYVYQFEIKLILFKKFNWHPFDQQDIETDKKFDVYLIYSDKDFVWVQRTLLEGLQRRGYLTVDRRRDFIIGQNDADQVIDFLSKSSRAVVVLSENLIKDTKAMSDFQLAETQGLTRGNRRFLLMITLQQNINFGHYRVFNQYINTNYFIPANNKRFWSQLFYWIPNRRTQSLPDSGSHLPQFPATLEQPTDGTPMPSESTPLLRNWNEPQPI